MHEAVSPGYCFGQGSLGLSSCFAASQESGVLNFFLISYWGIGFNISYSFFLCSTGKEGAKPCVMHELDTIGIFEEA